MFFVYTPLPIIDNEPVIRFYVEDRERYEHHTNPTFSSPADKNRVDLYSRLRVGADIQIRKNWSAKVEYQNTHDLFWTQAVNGSADNSDLSLGYVKYSSDSFNAIVGRQKIELGDQRLIGPTEWLSMARSFDAGRLQSGPWDAWAAKIGVANTEPETAQVAAVTHSDKKWGHDEHYRQTRRRLNRRYRHSNAGPLYVGVFSRHDPKRRGCPSNRKQ